MIVINRKNSKLITESILSITRPTSIFLFGSHAKNSETPDSDIDICIVTEEDKNPFDIMTSIRLSLFEKLNKAVDIIVYKKNIFDSKKVIANSFEYEIASTGVKLYG